MCASPRCRTVGLFHRNQRYAHARNQASMYRLRLNTTMPRLAQKYTDLIVTVVQVHQRLDKLDADVAAFKEAGAEKSSQATATPASAAPT